MNISFTDTETQTKSYDYFCEEHTRLFNRGFRFYTNMNVSGDNASYTYNLVQCSFCTPEDLKQNFEEKQYDVEISDVAFRENSNFQLPNFVSIWVKRSKIKDQKS